MIPSVSDVAGAAGEEYGVLGYIVVLIVAISGIAMSFALNTLWKKYQESEKEKSELTREVLNALNSFDRSLSDVPPATKLQLRDEFNGIRESIERIRERHE